MNVEFGIWNLELVGFADEELSNYELKLMIIYGNLR